MKVALESLGVLVVSGLLCLLTSLTAGRLSTSETAKSKPEQKDGSSGVAGSSDSQAERKLVELQERLDGMARRAGGANDLEQAKLKQAEASALELQARLDATIREAGEAAQAKQAELDQARLAQAQAQQTITELQTRLEAHRRRAKRRRG
jgi:hypothetical protein